MPPPLSPDKTSFWFGRYEIVGRLGMGGMGELYLARQWGPEGVRRDVALKVMLPDVQHKIPGNRSRVDIARHGEVIASL